MAFHTGPEIPCIKVQEAPQSVPKAHYIGLTMRPEGKTRGGGHVVVISLRSDVQSIYYIIFAKRGSKISCFQNCTIKNIEDCQEGNSRYRRHTLYILAPVHQLLIVFILLQV